MFINIDDNIFINRIDDLERFKESVKSLGEYNKVVFIFSKSGHGKSSFTKKIIDNVNNINCIKVPIIQSENSKINDGYFIMRLAEEINNSFKGDKLSLDKFLKRQYRNTKVKNEMISGVLKGILKSAINLVLQKYINALQDFISSFSTIKLPANEKDDILNFKNLNAKYVTYYYNYITEILKLSNKRKMLINIENINLIDRVSLESLIKITSEVSGSYFLFEFTIRENYDDLTKMSEYFRISGKNCVELYELNQLSFEDYVKIIKKLSDKDSESLLSNSYYQESVMHYDGNIRKAKDLVIMVSSSIPRENNPNKDYTNPTLLNIKALSTDQRFMLVLIVIHRSFIQIAILRSISLNNRIGINYNINDILLILTEKKLIEIKGSKILIAHDSITNEIMNTKDFFKDRLLAYSLCEDYYRNLLQTNSFECVTKHDALKFLLNLYFSYEPKKLYSFLEDIKDIAINSLNPAASIEFLLTLKDEFIDSASKEYLFEINLRLIDIYYSNGMFEEGYSILSEIKTENAYFTCYELSFLNRLDKHDEVIRKIENMLKSQEDVDSRYSLVLRNILLISYASINKYDACKDILFDILNNKAYGQYPEYGFTLRNSEIALSIIESIDYIKKSIDHFKDYPFFEAQSRISLAMQLARIGELKQAENELLKAKVQIENKTLEMHIIYNNHAAIMMYSNIFTSQVEFLLKQSLITSFTPFDKIVIYSNLLVVYSRQNKFSDVENIINSLLDLLNVEKDKEICREALYNIAFTYKCRDISNLYNLYMDKARQCLPINDDLWNFRINSIKCQDSNYTFTTRIEYTVGFISYWHFEISKNLMNC